VTWPPAQRRREPLSPWCWAAAEALSRRHHVAVELSDPRACTVAVLLQRKPKPLALHADDDMTAPAPVVEPGVERAEGRRLRRELEEAEGSGEKGEAAVRRDRSPAKPDADRRG
jgi:hypothetical protein